MLYEMMRKYTREIIPAPVKRLAHNRKTPFLAMDKLRIHHDYEQFIRSMPNAKVFYAVKTNSHKTVLKMMHALGSGFEISSELELEALLRMGVAPHKIISSNPLKTVPFIKSAHDAGIRHFAFDSVDEINKLRDHAPGSKVYVRLVVSNEGSQWPLSRKFGVESGKAVELLAAAAREQLVPYGITFHVGSQCVDEQSWADAITKSKSVWDMARTEGVELKMINIGGGFPIEYLDSIPSVDQISSVIKTSLEKQFPPDIAIFIEPGRAVVGEAGTIASTVIAKARRNEENWLYIDIGVFNGLMESIGGIQYSLSTERKGPLKKWILAGPSCDSMDIISNEVHLPELEIGDRVYITSAGAYTTAYASEFNGFPIPKTYFF